MRAVTAADSAGAYVRSIDLVGDVVAPYIGEGVIRLHMLRAIRAGRFEDWQSALQLWQHALSVDPDSRKYPRMIGLAQARLGNYEAGFSIILAEAGDVTPAPWNARILHVEEFRQGVAAAAPVAI